jgi:hypothetical protein
VFEKPDVLVGEIETLLKKGSGTGSKGGGAQKAPAAKKPPVAKS